MAATTDPASKSRLARYASLAVPIAAVPTMLLTTEADAAIYSATGLTLKIGAGGTNTSLTITGAGGANVGVINLASVAGSYAQIIGANFTWRNLRQFSPGEGSWFGGLPVAAGATWTNHGRTAGEFPGTANVIGTGAAGDINFGSSTNGGFLDDPQRVGNTGATWYVLFKFKAGSAINNYGWLSFTANVNGGLNPSAGSYITITGWGWDDSGSTIGAGVTVAAVPGGTGLAGLALGAAALRGRRRSRA